MGRLAVERVVAALQDGGGVPEPTVVRLPTSLSVRESTGPVRPAR
jgi:DNA-binding LacI/PurR family transcriptional regulator